MSVHRFVVAAAVLAAVGTGAAAQTQQGGGLSSFAQYLRSKANRDVINAVIRQQAARYPGNCTDVSIDPTFKVTLIAPVQFDGKRFTAGAWKETVQATSCGKVRTHNVHTFVRSDGALQRSPMLPGTTITDIVLQFDTAKMLYLDVAASRKECPRAQHFIEDTRFVAWSSKPIPNAKAGPGARAWDEDWTASACGEELVYRLRFTPDSRGTGFALTRQR